MVSYLFFYQLTLIALVWLCVLLQWAWPSDPTAVGPTTPEPPPPKRHRKPKPFAGFITKPGIVNLFVLIWSEGNRGTRADGLWTHPALRQPSL